MTLSLHSAFVPTCLQTLGGTQQILAKAQEACQSGILEESAVIGSRLSDDMLPFAYQVKSTRVHSAIAVKSLGEGIFSPDMSEPPQTLAGLSELVTNTIEELEQLNPADLDAKFGAPMKFKMGDFELDFTAENFLLSFSQPNFFFHATTAYGLLRSQGLAIGKVDFMGKARVV